MRHLSAPKKCQKQNQSNTTSVGGFDAILDTYNDPSLAIERPLDMDLENDDPNKSIDPHSSIAPGLEDDAQWLENRAIPIFPNSKTPNPKFRRGFRFRNNDNS